MKKSTFQFDLSHLSPRLRAQLAGLGIAHAWHLLLHLPLRYDDKTRLTPIADLMANSSALIQGRVIRVDKRHFPRPYLNAWVEDGSGELQIKFFRFYPSHAQLLQLGTEIRVYGEVKSSGFLREMLHPECQKASVDLALDAYLTPVYPTTKGLSQLTLRRLITQVWDHLEVDDFLPPECFQALWPALRDCLQCLHQPSPEFNGRALTDKTQPIWQRLKFEELLAQQLTMQQAQRLRQHRFGSVIHSPQRWTATLLAELPYALTAAQIRAHAEIRADLARPHPMQRLLQGDVGSGKTLVAVLAALDALEAGFQVAFLVPTEILAVQHAQKMEALLANLPVKVALLLGSMGKKQRDAVKNQLQMASAPILVVGTHALFQEGIVFSNLALVVIDEQHRFGVQQRLALLDKGLDPHQLMMSATPIPRTLSMTYFADLDVSVLDELPPKRTPIQTKLVDAARRDEMVARVLAFCAEGRQVYWVCPLVETSDKLDLQDAEQTFEHLAQALTPYRVGLVHGRQQAKDKQKTMQAFADGDLQCLVATTVIEVGVDVPNASVMVIEHAERMGLAQLHQLRGRVGRGEVASLCILMFQGPLSETARARLKVMYETQDGFKVAEQDLAIRGPGEFLGTRQSGVPMLRYADLQEDVVLIEQARYWAARLWAESPELANKQIQRWFGDVAARLQV